MKVIHLIEKRLKRKSLLNMEEIQLGDVQNSHADIEHSTTLLGYKPKTSIKRGVSLFIDWYRDYYGLEF